MSVELTHDMTTDELLNVSKALTLSLNLLLLDKGWTFEAGLASDPKTRDADRVRAAALLVDEIAETFARLREFAPHLVPVGERTDVQAKVEAMLASAGQPGGISPEVGAAVRHHLDHAGGSVMTALKNAVQYITERTDDEVDHMRGEYARLTESQPSEGDMSKEGEFATGVIATVAAAELGPLGFVVVEAVAHWICG